MKHRVRSHRKFGYQSIQDATASTMAAMAEVLGLALPGNAAIPGPDSRRLALAEMSGRRAVEMALAWRWRWPAGPSPPRS